MISIIFIVTTYVKTDEQYNMLQECLYSIHLHHPEAVIQVLDDDHSKTELISIPEFCRVEKTPCKQCGEVNAYYWSAKHKDEFEKFIFIHDSVKLINPLPLESDKSFRTLWYASINIHLDITNDIIDEFMYDFMIDNELCLEELYKIRIHFGSMSFGSMAVWDQKFCRFLVERTNFMEHASRLNTRRLRCFFERLVYILVKKYEGFEIPDTFIQRSICGDIYNHVDGFSNKRFDLENPGNPYAVKIWNGR
jgi:hypothetical protein